VFAAAIDQANRDGALAAIVDLSTPGGMRECADTMVEAIRHSRIPVLVWVGSSNMRVGGEGLRLLAEADVALMAPGAHLTPLWSEPARQVSSAVRAESSQRLRADLENGLAAHVRRQDATAELSSGKDSFSAQEALHAGFIDGIADRSEAVLRFAANHPMQRRIGLVRTPELAMAGIKTVPVGVRDQLLLALMNPDLSVLLLALGMLLIYLEINTPGVVVPGAIGLTLVLLAAYALHLLTWTMHGLLLCIAAISWLSWGARRHGSGILAVPGVALLPVAIGLLVRGPVPQLQVSWQTALGVGFGIGGVSACLLVLAARARRAKVKTGAEAVLGWPGLAQTPLGPEGRILVRGELWQARLTANDIAFVAAGARVRVLRTDGQILEVAAIPPNQLMD
jgi:membrane-bound serine protease (ClpP class)